MRIWHVLSATRWGKSTLIIAISGWSPKEIEKRGHTGMFDARVIKPIEFDALVRLLAVPTAQRALL